MNAGYEAAVVRTSDTFDSCTVSHKAAAGRLAQRPRPLTGGCLRGDVGGGRGGYIRYEKLVIYCRLVRVGYGGKYQDGIS